MLRNIIKLAYSKQKSISRYYVRKVRNPGIDRRATLLEDGAKYVDYEQLDDVEPDFSGVHKSHREYEKERDQYRERLQSWIVGNKYFKTKQLNFLTWSEKEQIRHLHGTDPNDWTIDKLTESFPADRYTIAKIIKAKWFPRDGNRVERHDTVVKENWELFRSGRIKNIDPGFAEHLSKFLQRTMLEVHKPKVETKRLYEIRPLPEGEFSAIITSCKKYAKHEDNESQHTSLGESKQLADTGSGQVTTASLEIPMQPAPHGEMFMTGKIEDGQHKTLKQLKGDTERALERSRDHELPAIYDDTTDVINVDKFKTVASTKVAPEDHPGPPVIRESIRIPKKLYKRGATYQLDDCFYDDDGEFLYRVPGMTGRQQK